jgi:SAM-dependent methyltransferase
MNATDNDTDLFASMEKAASPCNLCGGNGFTRLADVDRYRMGIQTCQCDACGIAMTFPMPTEASLNWFYTNKYRKFYRKFEHPSPELLESLGIAKRARHSAAFLKSHGVLRPGVRILDLGCADGSLLRAIREIEPEVGAFGVEPNPAYAGYALAHGVKHIWPELDSVPSDETFDLVIINHVLEHVRDPVGLLSKLKQRLSPGGAIYVDVPDAARYTSLGDLHIAHLYHFTLETLRGIAGRAGLSASLLDRHDPPHHPRSVRGLFVASVTNDVVRPDPEAPAVSAAIRRIARTAPFFFARQSLLGRILVGIPSRLWRAVSR